MTVMLYLIQLAQMDTTVDVTPAKGNNNYRHHSKTDHVKKMPGRLLSSSKCPFLVASTASNVGFPVPSREWADLL
jgi:hypothetical protein